MKGEVVYVEVRGKAARVGARSEDGLMWFWTTTGPAPHRGQVVEIPQGANPEPAKKANVSSELAKSSATPASVRPGIPEAKVSSPEDVERMLRAVALKAAAQLFAGFGSMAEESVLTLAEHFLTWLKTEPREV